MTNRTFRLAKSKEEKNLAYILRYEVYCIEEGFIDTNEEKKEKDEFDEIAQHFLAYEGEEIVGTVRLIEENSNFNDAVYGLPMESLFDFSEYDKNKKYKFAESSRSAVLRDYRRGRSIWGLWKAMIQYSLKKDITHILLSANPETDDVDYSQQMYYFGKKQGLLHPEIYVNLKEGVIGYDIEDQVNLDKFNLPKLVNTFVKIGCKFIGPAAYYPKVGMCSLPMVLDLNHINEPFRKHFLKEDSNIYL